MIKQDNTSSRTINDIRNDRLELYQKYELGKLSTETKKTLHNKGSYPFGRYKFRYKGKDYQIGFEALKDFTKLSHKIDFLFSESNLKKVFFKYKMTKSEIEKLFNRARKFQNRTIYLHKLLGDDFIDTDHGKRKHAGIQHRNRNH